MVIFVSNLYFIWSWYSKFRFLYVLVTISNNSNATAVWKRDGSLIHTTFGTRYRWWQTQSFLYHLAPGGSELLWPLKNKLRGIVTLFIFSFWSKIPFTSSDYNTKWRVYVQGVKKELSDPLTMATSRENLPNAYPEPWCTTVALTSRTDNMHCPPGAVIQDWRELNHAAAILVEIVAQSLVVRKYWTAPPSFRLWSLGPDPLLIMGFLSSCSASVWKAFSPSHQLQKNVYKVSSVISPSILFHQTAKCILNRHGRASG